MGCGFGWKGYDRGTRNDEIGMGVGLFGGSGFTLKGNEGEWRQKGLTPL